MNDLKETKMVDEITEEIVEIISNSKKLSDLLKSTKESDIIQKRNLDEIIKLKERVHGLENRVEKYIKGYRITSIEVERQISERFEKMDKENRNMMICLQGQLEELKTSMISLIHEVKRIKNSLKLK